MDIDEVAPPTTTPSRPSVSGPRPVVGSEQEPVYFLVADGPYRGSLPAFHDPAQVESARRLEASFGTIRDEVLRVLGPGTEALTVNFVVDPHTRTPGHQSINLCYDRLRYHRNRRLLPRTTAICDGLPGLSVAQVSVLQPGASLPEHNGDTNAMYRIHLGLEVPDAPVEELGIAVAGEARRWEEGRTLIIEDAHRHRVWNNTDRPRTILVVDVVKDELRGRGRWLAAQAGAGILLQVTMGHMGALRRLPGRARRALQLALAVPVLVGLPVQRRLGRLTRRSG